MSTTKARVKLVFKPSDYPGNPDEATNQALQEFFEHMFPGVPEPKPEPHSGYAIFAQNPRLAMAISKCANYIVGEMPWTQNRYLRELAVQTLNIHFKCDFSFQAHLIYGPVNGLGVEKHAAIPYWRTTNLFNDEEKLVIEYTLAVVSGDVPESLFARVVAKYGERGAIEFTTAIGWWSLWAMVLNAANPEFAPERSRPLPRDARELPDRTK